MAILPYNYYMKKNYEVIFYRDKNRKSPFIGFLNNLDDKLRAKTLMMIHLLEENGNELREPYTKSLNDGIFELRAISGSNITRSLFFFYINKKIIITNGFVKKTQKTPKKELEIAKEYKRDYIKGTKNSNMSDLKNYLKQQLKNKNFKKEWESLQPEMELIRTIVKARIDKKITQKELSIMSGINQADISKIETGTRKPSLKILEKIANALDMVIKVEFVPRQYA